MNILALMAHAEDAAYFCAGTLLKYREQGHNIYLALTTGSDAPLGAEAMGAEVRLLGFARDGLHDSMETRAATLTAIRWANADIILTHAPWDGDSDHAVTSKLAADSLMIVGGKLHPASLPPIDKHPHLFYCDTMTGNALENRYTLRNNWTTDQHFYLTKGHYSNHWTDPEAYVDITPYLEEKKAMLAGAGLDELARTQSRFRGLQMGRQYAESYVGHQISGYIADYRLLP